MASIGDGDLLKSAPARSNGGCAVTDQSQFPNAPSDEEALKLVLAFYCILEEDRRQHVLGLAQRYAAESKRAASDSAAQAPMI